MRKKGKSQGVSVVKNALRPFFKNKKELSRWKQFQTIRQIAQQKNFDEIFSITEGSEFYNFPGLGNTFPENVDNIPDSYLSRLTPLPLGRELRLHVGRINFHAEKVVAGLNSIASINELLCSQKWEEADKLIADHKKKFGFSLVIARKEFLVSLQKSGVSGISRRFKTIIGGAERRAWGVLCHVIYDLMDPAYHPGRSSRVWIDSISKKVQGSEWYSHIIKSEIFSFAVSRDEMSSIALRYSGTSLIDLIIWLWKAKNVHQDWSEVQENWDLIDSGIKATLERKFARMPLSVPSRYNLGENNPIDVEVYRLSFIFGEIQNVIKWRSQINFLFFLQNSVGNSSNVIYGCPLIAASSALSEKENGIKRSESLIDSWLKEIVSSEGDVSDKRFVMSLVVSRFLRELSCEEEIDEKYIVSVISLCEDLHEYVDAETFLKLVENELASAAPLLCFFIRDLLFRGSRTRDNDLERRAAFMDIFVGRSREDLVPYMDSISVWSMRAAEHLARVCTRGFLERLYLLMSSVKDVIETRIEICSWAMQKGLPFSESLSEEMDALKRELANLDARSDLDSTRVHVDEESLREWYIDTQHAKQSRYIQTVLAEGPDSSYETFLSFYSKVREEKAAGDSEDFLLDTQIGSEFILHDIFKETLKSFVSDRTFGLDSYLSRRIRHGTLSGFLITPIARVIKKVQEVAAGEERYAERDDLNAIIEMMEQWKNEVSEEVDNARRYLIQVCSDRHPKGLIKASWSNSISINYMDAMTSQVRKRVIETKGEYDIFSDIHSLCWDIIEADLADIRLYMISELYKRMTDRINEKYAMLSPSQRHMAKSFASEALVTFQGRVQEICGWFIRPVFRRDSYDLKTLIDSTLSIVRELDASYDFQEQVEVDQSVSINRGAFEVIGDVLFVLLGNAAKHGKRGGCVDIRAESVADKIGFVHIGVFSELESNLDFVNAIERIEEAAKFVEPSALDLAAVGEGFSGIRKIIGLLKRVKTNNEAAFNIIEQPDSLRIGFEVIVPSQVTFKRERT